MRPQYADALSCRCVGVTLHDVGRQLYTQSKHVVAAQFTFIRSRTTRSTWSHRDSLGCKERRTRGEDIKDVLLVVLVMVDDEFS